MLGFFFLKFFCPDISKNLKFFSGGETTPTHHGGQAVRSQEFAAETPNPFASRQPRHSAVSDRGYTRHSGRGQSQRQCCDCQQQENDGEESPIPRRVAQSGADCIDVRNRLGKNAWLNNVVAFGVYRPDLVKIAYRVYRIL